MAQQPHAAAGHRRAHRGGRVVAAAVIDVDDLVIGVAVESGADLGDERRDVRRLVARGDDDGEVHERLAV
jgi:hypothetical protein